jgi:hypothetical protein
MDCCILHRCIVISQPLPCCTLPSVSTLHLMMQNFRPFQLILQSSVQSDESIWSYVCPNLPPPQQTDSAGLIKHFLISSTETKQQIILRYEKAQSNRITRAEPLGRLLLLSFADLRLRWPAVTPNDPSRPATASQRWVPQQPLSD